MEEVRLEYPIAPNKERSGWYHCPQTFALWRIHATKDRMTLCVEVKPNTPELNCHCELSNRPLYKDSKLGEDDLVINIKQPETPKKRKDRIVVTKRYTLRSLKPIEEFDTLVVKHYREALGFY
jgi:hypothetical protein